MLEWDSCRFILLGGVVDEEAAEEEAVEGGLETCFLMVVRFDESRFDDECVVTGTIKTRNTMARWRDLVVLVQRTTTRT